MWVVCFVLLHCYRAISGYHSARMFRTLKGTNWKKAAALVHYIIYVVCAVLWCSCYHLCVSYFCAQTSTFYPGIVFGIGFFLNFFIWGEHSSGAVPFTTMLALLCLWFGISFPLTFAGFYFGYRKQPYEHPVRTNQIPRQIPEQVWYLHPFFA